MSAQENMAKAMAFKEEGNVAFKKGDYKAAMVAYHQIYMYVHGFSQGSGSGSIGGLPGQTTKPVTSEEMAEIMGLKMASFSNLAMCHLRLGNTERARDCCTKALNIDPTNVKALFRRGKCHSQLGGLDEAKADLERVLALEPDNRDALKELRELKAKLSQHRKKEQKKFAGFFDKLAGDTDAVGATSALEVDGGIGEPLGPPEPFVPQDYSFSG